MNLFGIISIILGIFFLIIGISELEDRDSDESILHIIISIILLKEIGLPQCNNIVFGIFAIITGICLIFFDKIWI